jgi:signal transduction histidine kinase
MSLQAESITPANRGRFRRFIASLAGRLLVLAILFVLLAEVMIFAPSLTDHYLSLLRERVNASQTAVLALEAAPPGGLTEDLTTEILRSAGVKLVALKRGDERVLRLSQSLPLDAADRITTVDLRNPPGLADIAAGFTTLTAPPGRLIRVLAAPRYESGEFIEVVMDEAPLQSALRDEAREIFLVSLFISLMVGAMIYVTLIFAIVRPVRRLTAGMERFAERPLDASAGYIASGRGDEIGRAEAALADMETQVRAILRQKERLAGLGSAVAKIAHDLRSSLASAQLIADRLSASGEAQAQKLAPRLERAIERATRLAESALRYGRGEAASVAIGPLAVRPAIEDAISEALTGLDGVTATIDAPAALAAYADAENTHRIMVNLVRNAAQAILGAKPSGAVKVQALAKETAVLVRVIDDGPGVPDHIRAKLFEPFATGRPTQSGKDGGTGLGLAIARELARMQGGDLALERSTQGLGAVFILTLPARAPAE